MTKVVICDVCGSRLDAASLEGQQRHVRATLRLEQLGKRDVVHELDFCTDCALERELNFSMAPFTDSLERGREQAP